MFQKPAFGSNTSGFGSFNAGSSTTTPFGGFKTNTGTSAFGAPPAFGASTSAQPATGGGLFGAAQPSTSLFGNTSASTSAPPFGASPSGFGFGGGASTSTGLFSQPNTSAGLFSNAQNTSAFGAKPSGFGFGNTSATPAGGMYGNNLNTGTSLFRPQNTSLGGGLFSNTTSTFGQQAATGTAHTKYNPAIGTDVVVKGGTSQNVVIKHHCITCMKEYENKSLEELRLEDYTAGRKGAATGGVFGGFQPTTENKPLFGGSTFGQPATTSAPSVFGGGSLNTSAGFQQPSTFSFGNNAQSTTNTTGGLFGAAKPAFGAPATSGTGLFGAATTQASTFGTNTSSAFGFGANTQHQSTGLFGAKPATTGFGAPATSGFGGFGASSAAPSLFGAKPQQTAAPAFGTAAPGLSEAELMRLEVSAYLLEMRLLRKDMSEIRNISADVKDIRRTLNEIRTKINGIDRQLVTVQRDQMRNDVENSSNLAQDEGDSVTVDGRDSKVTGLREQIRNRVKDNDVAGTSVEDKVHESKPIKVQGDQIPELVGETRRLQIKNDPEAIVISGVKEESSDDVRDRESVSVESDRNDFNRHLSDVVDMRIDQDKHNDVTADVLKTDDDLTAVGKGNTLKQIPEPDKKDTQKDIVFFNRDREYPSDERFGLDFFSHENLRPFWRLNQNINNPESSAENQRGFQRQSLLDRNNITTMSFAENGTLRGEETEIKSDDSNRDTLVVGDHENDTAVETHLIKDDDGENEFVMGTVTTKGNGNESALRSVETEGNGHKSAIKTVATDGNDSAIETVALEGNGNESAIETVATKDNGNESTFRTVATGNETPMKSEFSELNQDYLGHIFIEGDNILKQFF